MRFFAGDTQQVLASVRLNPHRTSCPGSMVDAVFAPPQRQECAMVKRCGAGQPAQPGCDPGTVLLSEFLGVLDAAARRHREHDFAAGYKNAKGETAPLPMAAQADRMNFPVASDCNGGRLAGPAIKQGAEWYRYHRVKPERASCVPRSPRTPSTLSYDLQQCRTHVTATVPRQREVGNARSDLGAEARTIEHAIVTDSRLHIVNLILLWNVDAECVRSLCLADARYIVVLAFHRHQRNASDRGRVDPPAPVRHLPFWQGMADEHGIYGLQIEFGGEIHDREVFIVEFTVLLGRIAVAFDEVKEKIVMRFDVAIQIHAHEAM